MQIRASFTPAVSMRQFLLTSCLVIALIISVCTSVIDGYDYSREPLRRTVGSVIPWPKELNPLNGSDYLTIKENKFEFNLSTPVGFCPIVQRAVQRYIKLSLAFKDIAPMARDGESDGKSIGTLSALNIDTKPSAEFVCESLPHEAMDESYELRVATGEALLLAKTSWGLIRGLETFSQLVFNLKQDLYAIRTVAIIDEPRFRHRGFMLDTARHYISLSKILDHLDAMSYNKLNVFHWHMVDDQSFPYTSKVYPQLSEKTAFRPHLVYTAADVQMIIRYAADRGIRVLPELDTPGHTYTFRYIPDVLTKCCNTSTGSPTGQLGPLDPTKVSTYRAVSKLIEEFASLFPESYFHSGGDEVDFTCWQTNKRITEWMVEHKMPGNYLQLNNYYIRRAYDILAHYNKTMLVWQEVFDHGAELPKDAIVHVWKYLNDKPAYMAELQNVVKAGYRAILSSCWYLNYIDYGQDWIKFYQCDPGASPVETQEEKLVLGGEICMWSEFVDDNNVVSRTWPRASAAAERLWSLKSKNNVYEFMGRLEQMRCRLLGRGIQAEPVSGPGYC